VKSPAIKDILFVCIQLLLFLCYFIPLFTITFQINRFLKYGALASGIMGLLIIAIAILQLNKNLTPFPTPKENGTLVQNGLYKFVRHPIYSGIILMAISFGLYYCSIWKISIGLALWILFYFKSTYEERMLSEHFARYKAYQKTTSRFFPFL
jgi:protein-S-isoprenylcysteine O-methyltransferase Ste14